MDSLINQLHKRRSFLPHPPSPFLLMLRLPRIMNPRLPLREIPRPHGIPLRSLMRELSFVRPLGEELTTCGAGEGLLVLKEVVSVAFAFAVDCGVLCWVGVRALGVGWRLESDGWEIDVGLFRGGMCLGSSCP